MNTIRVFIPVGKAPAQPAAVGSGPRTGSPLRVVGLLDNHKHNTDKVLERLAAGLEQRFEALRFVRLRKPEAGRGAPREIIDMLAAQCQAVVNGIGD